MSLYITFIVFWQRLRVRCGPGEKVGPGNLQGTPFSCYLSTRWHRQICSHQCNNMWANQAVLSSRAAWTLHPQGLAVIIMRLDNCWLTAMTFT